MSAEQFLFDHEGYKARENYRRGREHGVMIGVTSAATLFLVLYIVHLASR